MGGTMRLGLYPCRMEPDSWAARAYDSEVVHERHRHRWEVNNDYRERFEAVDLWPTGISPDGTLIEIMEYTRSRFMLGTQFHPRVQVQAEQAASAVQRVHRSCHGRSKRGRAATAAIGVCIVLASDNHIVLLWELSRPSAFPHPT